ncbi:hypothetical protein CYMTET_16368 [Cymbomonas tetramitiformis]|uniref:Uncharacterized protein n=1 Tax=Cymbomonas tetramitiformis TaxID=36881 RepID=A0AAE0GCN6_9CHLO|nr:hypothetical protein CYMTET_16368 [Cymbomonas tetramitiformis]|eukprot:gene34440-biopygen29979
MAAIREMVVTRQMGALAKNTQTGYSTGIRSFVSFCISGRNHGFLGMMLPAEDEALAAWVVFMVETRRVKPSTAKQYTSGVRALHLQLGLAWTPIRDRWQVVCAFDFNEKVIFAAMCFAFFGFFRKDNVSVDKEEAWNPRGQFVRSDIAFPSVVPEPGGVDLGDGRGLQQWVPDCDVRVRHSKTIQAGERYHHLRLRHVPDSPICPVRRLKWVCDGPSLGPNGPLFCVKDSKGALKPLTHSVFVATFRKVAERAGLDPKAYTGHSFRRGGATAAFRLQVQDSLIQAHGDWASDCYKLYCDLGPDQKLLLPSAMSEGASVATKHFFEHGG